MNKRLYWAVGFSLIIHILLIVLLNDKIKSFMISAFNSPQKEVTNYLEITLYNSKSVKNEIVNENDVTIVASENISVKTAPSESNMQENVVALESAVNSIKKTTSTNNNKINKIINKEKNVDKVTHQHENNTPEYRPNITSLMDTLTDEVVPGVQTAIQNVFSTQDSPTYLNQTDVQKNRVSIITNDNKDMCYDESKQFSNMYIIYLDSVGSVNIMYMKDLIANEKIINDPTIMRTVTVKNPNSVKNYFINIYLKPCG